MPDWLIARLPGLGGPWVDDADRMAILIDVLRQHVEERTGGPFVAGVFGRASGELLAIGVNLVEGSKASVAHAEIVALGLAGQAVGDASLAAVDAELVTTAEPCAMCLGAIPWSGVGRVVCGARDGDVRAIGFDEGDKPVDWPTQLAARGIEVVHDVGRADVVAALERYRDLGGRIY